MNTDKTSAFPASFLICVHLCHLWIKTPTFAPIRVHSRLKKYNQTNQTNQSVYPQITQMNTDKTNGIADSFSSVIIRVIRGKKIPSQKPNQLRMNTNAKNP
jgi:hypothetical protein